ncbi:MAG: helix-turn-helix domain-containing protein [Bacteroidetes bacterium]|nr:helix-turn-helix domain-containing protein [Bacteroidota bacterium]
MVNIILLQDLLTQHNNKIEPHAHPNLYQLVVIEEGEGEIILGEKTYQIQGHSLVSIPKNTAHSFMLETDTNGYVFSFSHHALESLLKKDDKLLRVLDCANVTDIQAKQELHNTICDIVKRCAAEYDENSEERGLALKSLSEQLFLALHRLYKDNGHIDNVDINAEKKLLQKFDLLIKEFHSPHVKLHEYCRELSLTPRRLSYLCYKHNNKSPKQIILERLVELIQNALLNKKESIKKISLDFHYKNASHFDRLFKKIIGISPRQYRIEHGIEEIA